MNTAVDTTDKSKPAMMLGTNGHHDYLVLARKGSVALAVKPNLIADGDAFGVPGTTHFGARLRSAPANTTQLQIDDTVVSFGSKQVSISESWNDITWEKTNNLRASTQIGVLFKGTPKVDTEVLLAGIGERQLATKMTDYLIGLAGEDNLVLSRREIIDWLDAFYQPIIAKILASQEKAKLVQTELAASIGTFGMQAALLKKVYGTTSPEDEGDFDDAVLVPSTAEVDDIEDTDDHDDTDDIDDSED